MLSPITLAGADHKRLAILDSPWGDPKIMKAFILDRYGKSNGTRLGEMPEPEVRDSDVLLRIHAAGVNPLDSKMSGRR